LGLFDKLKAGLARTAQQFSERFEALVERADTPAQRSRPIDVDTLEGLEELLIMADVGVAATDEIVEAVRTRARHGEGLRDLVKQEILRIFSEVDRPAVNGGRPHVTLIVGVNGTGKTTTVGKLASQLKADGKSPLICAADTFRAAAVDQLQIWADRAGVEMVRAREGSDPAAVVFDALAASKARGRDTVLVDTAGRLHTRTNLMNELDKIRRVAEREVAGAPHEVLLVLDANQGQNALTQATQFNQAVGVTGLVLTKLDGTAKGGIVIAIARKLGIPIRFIGVGEQAEDFGEFDARAFATALVSGNPGAAG